jgi:hypothetical protein
MASLLGAASRGTAMLCKYKSYASSLLGRVPVSSEADELTAAWQDCQKKSAITIAVMIPTGSSVDLPCQQ